MLYARYKPFPYFYLPDEIYIAFKAVEKVIFANDLILFPYLWISNKICQLNFEIVEYIEEIPYHINLLCM